MIQVSNECIGQGFDLRPPSAEDGARVSELIRRCPPLDANSLYCNLLQCTHFRDTCAFALAHGRAVGWLSAYRLPEEPSGLFVWQVAVAPEARGAGLGIAMLEAVLARESCRGVTAVLASITPSNEASRRMFTRFASRRGARIAFDAWLHRDAHFQGRQECELALRIAPIAASPGTTS